MNGSREISDGAKVILNTVKDEFFPISNELKKLLLDIHKNRIKFPLYSKSLSKLESRYDDISKRFYSIAIKLETPDDLFGGIKDNPQNLVAYFQFKQPIAETIKDASKYIEIADRTLDRRRERIQNFRTLVLALIAIIISLFVN